MRWRWLLSKAAKEARPEALGMQRNCHQRLRQPILVQIERLWFKPNTQFAA
jgi:hypothetical protein